MKNAGTNKETIVTHGERITAMTLEDARRILATANMSQKYRDALLKQFVFSRNARTLIYWEGMRKGIIQG